MTGIEIAIQVLTCSALVGLLGAVGMRLTYAEVKTALKRCRFIAILLLNFFAIPLLRSRPRSSSVWSTIWRSAMVLLAAAPFAPGRSGFCAHGPRRSRPGRCADRCVSDCLRGAHSICRANCVALFRARADVSSFGIWRSLAILIATTTLPLAIGVLVRHQAPQLGERLLRPVEEMSEAVGAASLAFVTATQFGSIVSLGWRSWLAMALISESLACSRLAPRRTRPRQPPGRRARNQQSEHCPRFARGHSKLSH